MRRICVLVALFLGSAVFAQGSAGLDQFLETIQPRELGPTIMGGRINELAVYEKDPRIFYVATASGGLWKTENGGVTMRPVFFKESSVALGTVAISQSDPNIVWVGTGEKDSRNSTSWGDGVYRSTDGGATWTHMGLRDSRHISKIILHPTKPNTVYVAALGHLWGENEERGVYMSEDAGATWKRTLYEGPRSGIIALEMDPKNPNNMLAASWERMRWAYKWASGGPSSFIYRSTDGGKTWAKSMKGIPDGDTGRIGVSYFAKDPKVVMAIVEKSATGQGASRVTNGGVFRSTDGGQSWTKTNDLNPRPFYFSQIRQDPVDENRVYVTAVQSYVSNDKGATFQQVRESVHVDHHAWWVNPNDNNHILHGSDGGVAESRDAGRTWEHLNYLRVGQFYAVSVDMRKPYWVAGGLQDNGSWIGPSQSRRGGVSMHEWFGIGGGDGFYTQQDPEDWRIVYSESQGGAMSRINIQSGQRASIRPRTGPDGARLRFNWNTPFIISPHNHQTLYAGSQFLHKSIDRGANWEAISPDLTTNDPEKQNPRAGVTPEDTGAERHCTITTVCESPMRAGVLWVGTDDGKVHLTRDGGKTWTDMAGKFADLPEFTYVSRIRASNHVEGRAYVTFDGHRNNDYKPYVYVTEDFGGTWSSINANLPSEGSTYVVAEGQRNPDLLFVGTEFGLYVSNTRGITWSKYATGDWPTVRVDDLVIHPRELDLVVGTHGRSIWIIPVSSLEQLTTAALEQEAFLCKPQNVYLLGYRQGAGSNGEALWQSPNTQPGTVISYHLKAATEDDVRVIVQAADGTEVANLAGRKTAGVSSVNWRPGGQRPIAAGTYSVILRVGTKELRTSVTVEDVSGGDSSESLLQQAG
jgi:photosystem II stability/assembly factor-like uncharacterized protein